MKLILLLLFTPLLSIAQIDKAVNDAIDSKLQVINAKIDAITMSGDTVGVIKTVSRPGVFYIDTISVANNSGAWFDLLLAGNLARGAKRIYVTNTNGTYKINPSPFEITFTGMTGGSWEVAVVNNIVMVKVTGTAVITNWKLTRLNL